MTELIKATEEVLVKTQNLKQRIDSNSIKSYEISNSLETIENILKPLVIEVREFWTINLQVSLIFLFIFVVSGAMSLFVVTHAFVNIVAIVSGVACIFNLRDCFITRKNTYEALQNFKDIVKSLR